MQTFLPLESFRESLKCLDKKRLGKQRVEAYQILNVLAGKTTAWKNHPAVLMWRGFESALKLYYNLSLEEWESRGFQNVKLKLIVRVNGLTYPWWFGDPNFHASHRSNLLRKDYLHYSQFGWTEPSNLPYVWPGVKKMFTLICGTCNGAGCDCCEYKGDHEYPRVTELERLLKKVSAQLDLIRRADGDKVYDVACDLVKEVI